MTNHDPHETYPDLDRLSTEQLEALLRADLDAPDQSSEAVIDRILEVIAQREKETPTGRLPDEDQAWAAFQQFYNIPEGEGQSLYPLPPEAQEMPQEQEDPEERTAPVVSLPGRRFSGLRKGVVAVAALTALLAGMVTAQAAGLDPFGAIGRWTEETFHFTLSADQTGPEAALKKAAEDCQLPTELLPTWHPAGFEAAEPQVDHVEDFLNSVLYSYEDKEKNLSYIVCLERYYHPSDIQATVFEKDDGPVEQYQSNGRMFYIMSNLETMTATWSDGELVVTIAGQLNTQQIKQIIDSIGG